VLAPPRGGACKEVSCRPLEKWKSVSDDPAEVHLVIGKRWEIICQVARREVALRNQFLKAHQQRVPGKRRETLVGGVAITSGTQREHLPNPLSGASQEIRESISFGTEVTDAESPGQRRGMEQDAATTGEFH